MKTASIGQAIVQVTQPRVVLTPLQLGLGVQLHHHFRSKFLLDTFHGHGFCCSYAEVIKFERSAAATDGTDTPHFREWTFVQYVADNVDHNIRTTQQLVKGKDDMRDKRTAKLWLQYLEMVEILLSFIKSDRTGNWQLHLKMD